MKRILITAAVEEELMSAKMAYKELFQGYRGLDDSELSVDFLITGIGTAGASYHLTKSLTIPDIKYDLILNIGIAGSFTEKYAPGTVVRVTKEQFGEFEDDGRLGFQTLFQYEVLDANTVPFKNGALFAPYLSLEIENALIGIPKVSGVSDRTHTESKNSDIESCEGAAIFYVALMEKIPFVELRAISNTVGEREKEKWETSRALNNLKEACKELFKAL